ncbi:uncharacterized protein [Nicotiana tomentosiformis]|uniref:uncharacterized protein n=1 Tax=Nicotiana tomentosiformis TaxID=4098 RepID=UPI00388C6CBB
MEAQREDKGEAYGVCKKCESQVSGASQFSRPHHCYVKCGRCHSGVCHYGTNVCYECVMRDQIQKDCRSSCRALAGMWHNQPVLQLLRPQRLPPAGGTIAPARRGAARSSIKSSGGPSKFYAMRRHQKLEASPDVVIGLLTVQSQDVYALIDPGSTLSYVIPYVAMEFGIEPEQLYETFSVSTL